MRDRSAVKTYVASLGSEAREWLLALFVDRGLHLLAVDTVAVGTLSDCAVPFRRIISRGFQLEAHGFILVHNHPSGDAAASEADILVTRRLTRTCAEVDLRMLDHLIIAGDELRSVGEW